ncbi:MAG TPA: putative Ig domain-containing protein, partial [Pirellulales bacterium]|nr:putative Ig domain-containing protein [Pirellulales bacterium]
MFALNTAGALSSIPGSGSSTQFPGTYWSIALGPDDALYALQASGNLGDVAVNSANVELVASGVLAIVADTTGDLYKLYTTGALSVMCAGSTTWTPLLTNVKSVTPSGGGASVLTNAGVDWQYLGTAGTLVAGPHLSLTMGGAATAGQSVSATLAVLDLNNNPVLGYTGTVTLSDSDGAAAAAGDGPPLTHTFSAADNGTFSFPVIFLTSGSQTLSVAGNGGLTASASVTVSAGAATQFSVDPPPVPVGTLIPVTAATWASDVVTIATPPLAGGFSVGDSLTISGMTPAGYNGTITIASVLSDTQFTYLLTTDPGTATGFGGVVPHATVTVTAYDANGNVATGYTGSVTLAPVDNSATSPITYTFTTADQGTHQFSETFSQPGGQKLVATGGSLAGDGAIVVTPASYDLSQSIVSLSPEGVAADGQVVVTLTARDALGNQETGGGLQAAFGLAAGSVGGGSFSGATDNGDGTYTAIFTAGPFAGLDNITATIGGVPVTSSPASLVVTPAITSVNHATFVVGTDGSFTVTQTGTATPVYSESGKFPSGVTFDTSTGILSGTPAAGSGGVYNIVIGAASGSGPAGTQNFTLVVDQAPAIDSASQSLFVAGEPASFTVRATGFPGPTISETGTLPTGVAFAAGVLGGTPAAGSEGTYPLTFTAHNAAGADATQSFVLTVATALAATEGAPFSGQLATFSGANPNAQLSDYTVSVNWGDTTSATLGAGATLSGTAANGFTVTGSHTYAEESSNVPVQVVITDTGGASPVTANDTINIADAPLTATAGSAVSATEGATFLNVAVATFADANPAGVAGDYTATIDWGDKTALTTVTGSAFTSTGGVFSVPSSHAYAEDGSYTLTVIISDVGGSTTTVKPVATVVDAALGATAVPVTATEGTTFSGIVATFTDANPAGPTGDYTATIDWGDKSALTTVSGSAFTSAGGVFSVPSTHLYSEDGSYTLTVTISDVGGASATVKPIATVGDAALSATAVPVVATEGTTFNGTVATFADANPAGATGDYTATIDWGDGSPLTTVSGSAFTSAGGVFSVPSSHLYSEDGSYTLTVTISDVGGSTTTVKPVATVADAALSATAVPVVATEGATFSGTVVTFTDANPAGPTGDYTATIDWGDKTA